MKKVITYGTFDLFHVVSPPVIGEYKDFYERNYER